MARPFTTGASVGYLRKNNHHLVLFWRKPFSCIWQIDTIFSENNRITEDCCLVLFMSKPFWCIIFSCYFCKQVRLMIWSISVSDPQRCHTILFAPRGINRCPENWILNECRPGLRTWWNRDVTYWCTTRQQNLSIERSANTGLPRSLWYAFHSL